MHKIAASALLVTAMAGCGRWSLLPHVPGPGLHRGGSASPPPLPPPPTTPPAASLVVNPSGLSLAELAANDLKVLGSGTDDQVFPLAYRGAPARTLRLVALRDLPASCPPGPPLSWSAEWAPLGADGLPVPGSASVAPGQSFIAGAWTPYTMVVTLNHAASCGSFTAHLLVDEVPPPPPSPPPPLPPAAIPDGGVAVPPTAAFELVAMLSAADGCKPTFSRTVAAGMALNEETSNGDSPPYLTETVTGTTLDHWFQVGFVHMGSPVMLFELFADGAEAGPLRQLLLAGKTVQVASSDCMTAAPLPFHASLSIHPGPDAGPAKSVESLNFATDQASRAMLSVSYAYDAAKFSWSGDWTTTKTALDVAPLSGVRYAFFDGAAQAFLSDWVPGTKDMLLTGHVTVTDRLVLHRLLPHLSEVDLVIEATGLDGLVRYDLWLGTCEFDAEHKSYHDLSHPERTCADLHEKDLPPLTTLY